MGTFRITIEVSDLAGSQYVPLEALVDTGASYTLVPRPVLEQLGIEPEERWPFTLADDRIIERDIAWARVRFQARYCFTVVVFGEPGAISLFGAHALEGLHLAVDPVGRRLMPVPGLLMVQLQRTIIPRDGGNP